MQTGVGMVALHDSRSYAATILHDYFPRSVPHSSGLTAQTFSLRSHTSRSDTDNISAKKKIKLSPNKSTGPRTIGMKMNHKPR